MFNLFGLYFLAPEFAAGTADAMTAAAMESAEPVGISTHARSLETGPVFPTGAGCGMGHGSGHATMH
jgi:hypothetical protein